MKSRRIQVTREMLLNEGGRGYGSLRQGTVELINWKKVPKLIGVYAFVYKGRFIYIGKAINLFERIKQHKEKNFIVTGCDKNSYEFKRVHKNTTIKYWVFSSETASFLAEKYLIQTKRPERNIKNN